MSATADSATDATPSVVRIKWATFDDRAERLGATDDLAKAELCGINRITLWRYRTGRLLPNLSRAMTIAERLELTLDELVERVAA